MDGAARTASRLLSLAHVICSRAVRTAGPFMTRLPCVAKRRILIVAVGVVLLALLGAAFPPVLASPDEHFRFRGVGTLCGFVVFVVAAMAAGLRRPKG